MSEYLIQEKSLSDIADAIREKTGSVDAMTPAEMAEAILGIQAGGFPNGTEWTKANTNEIYVYNLCYGAGLWHAAAGFDGLYYSYDGKTWEPCSLEEENVLAVHYGDGLWVAGAMGCVCYSDDGINWTSVALTEGQTIQKLNYTNGVWTALGGGFHCSQDGKTWTTDRYLSTTMSVSNDMFTYFANGVWHVFYSSSTPKYSTDGITWTGCTGLPSGNYAGLLYHSGVWVLGSGSSKGLYYSTDGIAWTASNITTGAFPTILHQKGRWIAYAKGEGIYFSDDGMNWTVVDSMQGYYPCIGYGKGRWIAVGSIMNTGIYYSDDGENWHASNETTLDGSYDPFFANGVWIAMGHDTDYNNVAFWSTDGETWTQIVGTVPSVMIICQDGVWVSKNSEGICYSVAWEKTK